MGERNYKVNDPVPVLYQAPGKLSGQTVVAEIYLPNGSKDSSFPDFNLTERGSSGTYYGTFTPDQLGEWQVVVHLQSGEGQVTKRYSVGTYDVTGVGVAVEGVETKVDTVDGKVDGVQSTVDGMDTQLDTVESKIDSISTTVGGFDTPPMIS